MKLALGTVQFGMDYGVSNSKGKVPFDEVVRILGFAWKNGIDTLDTAIAYGESEHVLGQAMQQLPDASFKIVTKLPKLDAEEWSASGLSHMKQQFAQSLSRLGKGKVYGLLLHEANDLLKPGANALYDWLVELKKQRQVKKIGVSVYDPEQTKQLMQRFDFDLVQLPLNVFDQRFISSGCLESLGKNGVEIHTRSTFLQGFLLMSPEAVRENLPQFYDFYLQYQKALRRFDLKALSVALSYVQSIGQVSKVLVGVTSVNELAEVLALPGREICSVRLSGFYDGLPSQPETLNDPRRW